MLLVLLLTGCSAFTARDMEPEPTSGPALNTIDGASVGMRLTVTATVATSITPTSFVVKDADLPPEGLLVLDASATAVRPSDLVTVDGTVVLFDFTGVAGRHELTDATSYAHFDGGKVLEARTVRSWAERGP
jgi:hypothetical protein